MNTMKTILSYAEEIGYWEKLAPGLTITRNPLSGELTDFEVIPSQRTRMVRQVVDEGYFNLDPVLPEAETHTIANAIRTITAAGLPPVFCFVYDEVWQVFARLHQVLEPILDPGYKFQTLGIWAWHIDNQSAGFQPHRDLDNLLTETDGRPSSLTIWIPLTDATPNNGCLYVLPINMDPNYPNNLKTQSINDIQCIRALPAKAGSVLGWTANILHWGARSSHLATEPRISIGVSYNRANNYEDPEHRGLYYNLGATLQFERVAEIPLCDRLNYIGESIWFYRSRLPEIFPDTIATLFDFCRDHYVSPTQPAEVDAEAANILSTSRKHIVHNLWQAGRRIEAQIGLRQLCEDFPQDADAWQLRGQLETSLNQLDTAEYCYKQAIAIQNDLPAAHKGLDRVRHLKRSKS
ncbi:phytanoyl-CoA dioxygenase family protein [Gammaproteobacteria bacterium]|nr:phytanoyl-CoA dioxygenase family protein [Gammaproteobacteria bacterium]